MNSKSTTFSRKIKSLAIALFFASATITGQAQSITLLAPNGGEAWLAGKYEEVSWTGQGLGSTLALDFSPDGGTSWWPLGSVTSSPSGGSSLIFVPFYISNNALLKITDINNTAVSDVSDASFTVSFPPISIWEPSSSSGIFTNTPAFVYWEIHQPGISLLNAELSVDNGLTFTPIAQNINATLGYTYLDLGETPAEACILKLYNAEDPSVFDLSQVFQIRNAPVYTLTSPLEGEIVNTSSLLTISWNVQNLFAPENYIEFSDDNGETWEIILYGISQGNSGSVLWFTPNVNSDECLIRITDNYSTSSTAVTGVFTIMSYPETPVCMVTVDSLTNQNVVIWEKPESDLIADFLIYRETDDFNVYEVFDTVSYQDVPMAVDVNSNPANRPYRYKIGFRDSTNRVFPLSEFHQTIHLTINQGAGGNWNLIWTPYTGFSYNSYKIMRKTGDGPFEQIASISASFTSFTDFNAPSGDVAYMISIVNPNGCNTGLRNNFYTDVYSNQAAASLVSAGNIDKAGFNVYPVPAKDRFNIQFGSTVTETIFMGITDVTGRIIHSAVYPGAFAGQVFPIETSTFPDGIYLLNIVTPGERMDRKFVVRH